MNATAIAEEIRVPAQNTPASWKSYLIFTLCSSLYLLPFMRIILAGTDEGTFLVGASRIVHGQVFARDFFESMGPGTFYLLAAFFKLFGITFLASQICLFISSLGTAFSLYLLSCRVCSRYRALPCLIVAGTYMGTIWPGISHHVDSNFFTLLAVVCLVLWHDSSQTSLLIAAGVLTGVTTCIYQPKGVLLFCAILIWLWLQRRKTSDPLFVVVVLTGSYLAVVGLVLIYFQSQGALGNLFYMNFVFPRQHYVSANGVVYAFSILQSYWTPWVMSFGGGNLAIAIAAILIVPFFFVAVLPALMLLVGFRCKWKSITPDIALYWLSGCALWLSELHRDDIEHLVFGSPILIVLCIHALAKSRKRIAGIAIQIFAISAVCLAGFNCCVVLAAGVSAKTTRVGKVAVLGHEAVLKFLDEHTSPGEEILIYPWAPTYYFLSATTNPTRYSFLQNNYNTPEQFQEVANILDQRRIRYVVWDTTFETRAAEIFPGLKTTSPGDLIIERCLESHYKLVKDDNGIHIMERK
jgi:4-amino-4-deoxy-L-arabinose transferase-like glycosyltransferase